MEIITYNENNHKNTIIMKTKNLLVVAFAGLIALAACKKEPSVTPTADNSINLSASVYGFTKATDTAFEEGDEIGVNVFAGNESWLENALYTYSSTGLTSKTPNAWYDDEELEATLTAYYPYEAGFTGTFSVNADQSTVEKYAASDLLVATAKSLPTEEAINLPFKHALSKVVINVDNQLKEEIENVWFTDVYGEVTFELSDPETLAASGSKGTVKAYKSGENKWQFIIAPQADATPKLALTTTSGKQYTFILNEAVTFSAGKVSTATVTVSTETIYTSFTADIEDWVADNELNFSQDDTQVELPEEEEEGNESVEPEKPAFCTLVIRVNKAITWYDKYVYTWGVADKTSNEWPGAKTEFLKEETDYYVYYHNFDASAEGTQINYIVNGGNEQPQTVDLQVTLQVGETVVTIEATDVKTAAW